MADVSFLVAFLLMSLVFTMFNRAPRRRWAPAGVLTLGLSMWALTSWTELTQREEWLWGQILSSLVFCVIWIRREREREDSPWRRPVSGPGPSH